MAKDEQRTESRPKADTSHKHDGPQADCRHRTDSHHQDDQKYTKPELRAKLKDEIQRGDKGGRPGQWSARKSRLLVNEYEKHGGGYTTDERDAAQKHLEQWQDEEWTTEDGKPAERDDVIHRYLPKEAWEKMSAEERREADAQKVRNSKGDTQYVANTAAAREARKEVSEEHHQD